MADHGIEPMKIFQALRNIEDLHEGCSASDSWEERNHSHQGQTLRRTDVSIAQVLHDVAIFLERAYKPRLVVGSIEVKARKRQDVLVIQF